MRSEASPREVFDQVIAGFLETGVMFAEDLVADDVVVEVPFHPDGPRRWESRAAFAAFAAEQGAPPVRFEDVRNIEIHETTDPEVIVAEYEISGTSLVTGEPAGAGFIAVLRVRGGRIVRWREYQDVMAVQRALAS